MFLAGASAACENPKVQASSYTSADSQVLSAIPFITEFSLGCSNDERPVLYADIEGTFSPVVTSADGTKYQVSWIKDLKKATTGDYNVDLYDTEGYAAAKKARDRGDLTKPAPLATIVVSYPGSYAGPWLKSEHLAAGLAALVFLPGFLFKIESFGLRMTCEEKICCDNGKTFLRIWNSGKNHLLKTFPKRIKIFCPGLSNRPNCDETLKDVWMT